MSKSGGIYIMSNSTFRGYRIQWSDGQYVFCDTGDSVKETWEGRPCGHCHQYSTTEGHDACLGTLPNVMNACCGHGELHDAYVQFSDGVLVQGENTLEVLSFILMKNNNLDRQFREVLSNVAKGECTWIEL